jgi:hypothetical protein
VNQGHASRVALFLLFSRCSIAGAGDVASDLANREPEIRQLRYLEDHSELARPRHALDTVKHVALWPGGYLSLGGQHRLRYEFLRPSGLGTADASKSILYSRNLVHVDLHPLGGLRFFAQVGAFYAVGAAQQTMPPGVNFLDVTQAFVETSGKRSGIQLTVRVGRQEMALGSTRWVSVRDGTNMRQSFDLARLVLVGESWLGHSFGGLVPQVKRGAFDDRPDLSQPFWGTYWTFSERLTGISGFDLFYLGHSHPATFRDLSGRELRHTFGTRVFGSNSRGLEYIAHGLLQVGTLESADVFAWGASATVWQRLPPPIQTVRLGLRGEALSGDSETGDSKVGTFDPLFHNQVFFSALAFIAPRNLYDLHPLVTFEIESVRLVLEWIFYFRQQNADAVYLRGLSPLVDASDSSERDIGSQLSLSFGYRASRYLTVGAEYSRVFAGSALHDAGVGDVEFFSTSTTLTY